MTGKRASQRQRSGKLHHLLLRFGVLRRMWFEFEALEMVFATVSLLFQYCLCFVCMVSSSSSRNMSGLIRRCLIAV
jgi:hypothetical protein